MSKIKLIDLIPVMSESAKDEILIKILSEYPNILAAFIRAFEEARRK